MNDAIRTGGTPQPIDPGILDRIEKDSEELLQLVSGRAAALAELSALSGVDDHAYLRAWWRDGLDGLAEVFVPAMRGELNWWP